MCQETRGTVTNDAKEDIQKKIRHGSSVSWDESPQTSSGSHTVDENSDVQYISYPLNPSDISQIASELRVLMAADLRFSVVELSRKLLVS